MVDKQPEGEREDTSTSRAPAFPGTEAMLGAWTSWIEAVSTLSKSQAPSVATPTPLLGAGMLEGDVRRLGEWLAKDPILLASEQALNANPLRQVIPVDWAEIARALRTVWLHHLSRPETAMAAAMEFNRKLFQATFDTWTGAAQRWWGVAPSDVDAPGQTGGARRQAFRRPGVAE